MHAVGQPQVCVCVCVAVQVERPFFQGELGGFMRSQGYQVSTLFSHYNHLISHSPPPMPLLPHLARASTTRSGSSGSCGCCSQTGTDPHIQFMLQGLFKGWYL